MVDSRAKDHDRSVGAEVASATGERALAARCEDDLRVIAEHGYEGATSTDHDQRAQALSRFITEMLAARRSARNSVAAVATSFQ